MTTAAPARVPDAVVSAVARLREYEEWAPRCYRIRNRAGKIVRLRLNSVQRAIGTAEREALQQRGKARLYVLKARRPGVSTDQQARCLHQIWSAPGFDAMTLAHAGGDMLKLFEITQRAIDHFPPALLPRLGERETTEISFPGLDSHFYTGTAGAKRTGRGLTLKRLHGSEFAYWGDPVGTLNTIKPAMEGVRESVIVLETTPSGYDTEGHRFWRQAQKGENEFTPLFFPWWDCDPANYREPLQAADELGALSKEEEGLQQRFGLDLEQIKWRRLGLRSMGQADFFKEYPEDPESCWALAGGLYFDADVLRLLSPLALAPLRTEMGGALRIYREPVAEKVVIGADTAEGRSDGGGDLDRSAFSARTISGRLVADFEDRIIAPRAFASILAAQGRRLSQAGPALLVVEKNAHGITVLRALRDDEHYPIERIYQRPALDAAAQEGESEGRLGWATTAASKPLLLDAGRELLAAAAGEATRVDPPPASALRDAFAVRRDERGGADLQGRDVLVADMLAWIGRSSPQLRDYGAGVVVMPRF